MTDENGAAEAAAEPVAAPEAQDQHSEPTARDSIDRAFAEIDARESGDTPAEPEKAKPEGGEPKPETPEGDQPRGPDGKFVAKDQPEAGQEGKDAKPEGDEPEKGKDAFSEAPSRFSPDAKDAWKETPEPVRAEINRAVTEMERGLAEYQQRFEPLKPYEEMASKHGTTIDRALEAYTQLDGLLETNIIEGLEAVCQNKGFSLRDIAAHVMGQPADEVQSQTDATIRGLRDEISNLKNQLSGVTNSVTEGRTESIQRQVDEFARSPGHERFNELQAEIATEIQAGHDLETAYKRAVLLNPAPAPAAPAATPETPAAQTPDKGSLSVTGAPGPGSDPAARKTPSSAREAVDNAFAALGL